MVADLLTNVPVIEKDEDLEQYLMPLYIMENYWESKKKYREFQQKLQNLVRGAFRLERYRTWKVKVKFYKEDKTTYEMELRQFLYNVYTWYAFCDLYGLRVINEEYILQPDMLPDINDFISNKIIKLLQKYNIKYNKPIADVIHNLNSISLDFSLIMGLHYEERHFIEMYENPVLKELIDMTFEPGTQPTEIESMLAHAEKVLVDTLKKDPMNPLGIMLRSKTGMKTKQLVEFLIAIALRPSLEGAVIPIAIDSSTLIGGLKKPSYIYLDALAARKPLLANNKEMGKVGYFGKTLNMSARTLRVSKEILDCHTPHLVSYQIKTEKHLAKFVGKYMEDEDGDIVLVDTHDLSLIGKTIKVRSPITCCCGQNSVCARCVGTEINWNWDITEGFAVFETEEYSKDVEQNVLSTKHLLTTNSEKIEFSANFNKYFVLNADEIHLQEGMNGRKDLAIFIDPDDIKKVEEFDPNSTYNTYIESGKFSIINTRTGEIEDEIFIKNEKEIYICTTTSDIMYNNSQKLIPFKELDEEIPVFEIFIQNSELVKPFYDLINLLDKGTREMEEVTIDTMAQRFLDIIIEAKINVPVVSGELILNRLCRDANNVRRRPAFHKKKMPAYNFYQLSKTVEENGSITLGLTFEQLMRQLMRLDIEERTDQSFMDVFFKEEISMEPFYRHKAIAEASKEDDD